MPPRRGLAEDLADTLVADILAGTYPPQSMLPSEVELATMSGLSRLTVREAVKSLKAKSVLRVIQGTGTFVNAPDEWSPLDPALLLARSMHNSDTVTMPKKLLEARRIVEVGVASLAAERRTESHLDRMRESLQGMEDAHASGDVEEFVQADIAFHQSVLAAADNPFMAALFQPLEAALLVGRRQTSAFPAEREHAIAMHRGVYEAITSGDPVAARAAMADHMTQTQEDFDTFVVDHMAVLRLPEEQHPRKRRRAGAGG